jgi:hypothetical protein
MQGHPAPLARVEIDGETDYIVAHGLDQTYGLPIITLQYNGAFTVADEDDLDRVAMEYVDGMSYKQLAELLGGGAQVVAQWAAGANFNEAIVEAAYALLDNTVNRSKYANMEIKVIYDGDKLQLGYINFYEGEDPVIMEMY